MPQNMGQIVKENIFFSKGDPHRMSNWNFKELEKVEKIQRIVNYQINNARKFSLLDHFEYLHLKGSKCDQ